MPGRCMRMETFGEDFVPDLIAFWVHVEAVVAEEFFAGLAVVAEDGRGDLNIQIVVVFFG